jgi:hypothetical protein
VSSSEPRLGPPVDPVPARAPERTTLTGRLVTLVALDPEAHGSALYQASHGPEREDLWRYLFDGPYPNLSAFESRLR